MKNPNGSNPNVRLSSQSGVSLVELMVAMVIALLLATAIGGLFVSSKGSFRLQSGTSAARESGLAVVEDLSREIRRAGNYGCFSPRDTKDANLASGFLSTAVVPVPASLNYPIPTMGVAPNQEPRVGPAFATYSDSVSNLSVTGPFTLVAGSEFLQFNFGDPVAFLNADMDTGTDPLQLGQPVYIADGMPLLLSTCTRMTLLRSNSGGATGAMLSTVAHTPGGNNVALSNPMLYHKYARGTTVMKLAASRLFVATATDGTTHLYRHDTVANSGGTPQPFASNVMDMRVRLALDNGAGGVTWNTGAAITAANKWPEILGAQVHFVVASSESVPGPIYDLVWNNAQGFIQGSTVVADGKPRRAFVVTSSIRGRNEIVGR